MFNSGDLFKGTLKIISVYSSLLNLSHGTLQNGPFFDDRFLFANAGKLAFQLVRITATTEIRIMVVIVEWLLAVIAYSAGLVCPGTSSYVTASTLLRLPSIT